MTLGSEAGEARVDHEEQMRLHEEFEERLEDLCLERPDDQTVTLVARLLKDFGEDGLRVWATTYPQTLLEAYINQHRKTLAEQARDRGTTAQIHPLSKKQREKE